MSIRLGLSLAIDTNDSIYAIFGHHVFTEGVPRVALFTSTKIAGDFPRHQFAPPPNFGEPKDFMHGFSIIGRRHSFTLGVGQIFSPSSGLYEW